MAEALISYGSIPGASRSAARSRRVAPGFTTVLAVDNMHCGGCMRKVEQSLASLPDVSSARVNLSSKRVTITTRSAPRSVEPFIEALKGIGFSAKALAETPDDAARPQSDRDYLKRLGVAGFAAANIMLLSVSVWSGHASDMPASMQTMFHWLSAMIALPAIAYAGQPFFLSARQALAARSLNMDVPISLGVVLATGMSLFQTVRGSEQVYFDAAITLLFFLLIGRALDQRMRARAASAAENLAGLRAPATSVIQPDGQILRIATSSVLPGMRLSIAAGERVPVDARVTDGGADVDESLITGESLPRHVTAGDMLYAGTIAVTGPIEAEATAVAENTVLSEIASLMRTAEQARGRYVRLADRAARLYAPAVHILGFATFIGWLLAGYGWERALTAAIAVLIITCPCALALAVPAVQVVATSRLFRRGVVLKAADGLERLAGVDTILFDKTGTLTIGSPRLANADALTDSALELAAGMASQSHHPYSKAIVQAARKRGLGVMAIPGVSEIPGAGLQASVDGRTVRLGSSRLCGLEGSQSGEQGLWFCDGRSAPLALTMVDAIRDDARSTVQQLKTAGFALEIVSGDRPESVAEVARELGIAEWRATQRPDEKMARIEDLKRRGRKILMIGDGLNDAPALAGGHASLSPSSATDISQTAADAVFQGDGLAPVSETIVVAKAARRRAYENFAIAVGYNAVFVPLAVIGLVTPLIAAIAMSASSIAVTANALRLAGRSTTGEGR